VLRVDTDGTRPGLSSDGRALVQVFDGAVEVWSLTDGQRHARFPLDRYAVDEQLIEARFRQDDSALLLGVSYPKLAIDPSSGVPIHQYDLDDWLRHHLERIDWSWRWVYMDDGSLMRTLDGRRLYWQPGARPGAKPGAMLDTGHFEGDIDGLAERVRFRAHDDPLATPELRHADLRARLERPGVLAEFFAGDPLPPLRVTRADYQTVLDRAG
ncbi:MAG TPA: hypothetical protein VK034_07755, partial [Enhygromyxa sp.]|nr:hypothetical protein [Enhygromyxa sp.]